MNKQRSLNRELMLYELKLGNDTAEGIKNICWTKGENEFEHCNRAIDLVSKVFVHGPGDRGSILGRVIPKTQNMVLDAALLSTLH